MCVSEFVCLCMCVCVCKCARVSRYVGGVCVYICVGVRVANLRNVWNTGHVNEMSFAISHKLL